MARKAEFATILDGVEAAGAGTAIDVLLYRHVTLVFEGEDDTATDPAVMTPIIKGTAKSSAPADWTAAAAADNSYGSIGGWDQDTLDTKQGSTGIAFAANGVKQIVINTDGLHWLNVDIPVANYTSGKMTVTALLLNDSRHVKLTI